jgi:hypothetical protein
MAVYGLITSGDAMYAKSAGVNINLAWGSAMFVFGVLMYIFGRRSDKRLAGTPIEGTSRPLGSHRPGGH